MLEKSLMRGIQLLAATVLLHSTGAVALTGVNPTGVNVNASGATTVFLSFLGVGPDEQEAGAFWCGEITVAANTVTSFNPCVPGTLYGNLPARNNLSRRSGTQGASNVTDIMTIPPSVARRAYQDAQRGEVSTFFYVRRFINTTTSAESYVAVTCRMAGGGARVPLALTDVRIDFEAPVGDRPVYLVETGMQPPPVAAKVRYNGSGRLTGRWEVVRPGDPLPRARDLLPEASLPVEQRGLQQRYTQLSRIEMFLPPTGSVTIPGPDPALIPTDIRGAYWLLLRIEATRDKEGDSNTSAGVASSGGVAGFPLPPLRYYVGNADELSALLNNSMQAPTLRTPAENGVVPLGIPLRFTWADTPGATLYRLEVRNSEGVVLNAVVPAAARQYDAPPWLSDSTAGDLRWRLVVLDDDGDINAATAWQQFAVE